MSELAKRGIFGSLYVIIMLSAVLLKSPALFLTVFSFLAFVGMWEYATLSGIHRTRQLRVIFDALMSVYLIIAVYVANIFNLGVLLLPFLVYIVYITIRSMYSNREHQPAELSKTIFGHIYITLPLMVASFLHSPSLFATSSTFLSTGQATLLLMLVCIWSNDTGAFIAGSLLGKHKLFPSLSPKKSWEGFWGGVFFSALASWLIVTFVAPDLMCPMRAIGVGILISIFATWGDLFESMLKRNAGVKDSGAIIPGHGGILDRIDSILFVIPMVSLTLWVIDLLQASHCTI